MRLERIQAVTSEKMPVPVIDIDSIDADERLATIDDIQYMCPIRNLQVRYAFGSCLTYCLIGALPSMIYITFRIALIISSMRRSHHLYRLTSSAKTDLWIYGCKTRYTPTLHLSLSPQSFSPEDCFVFIEC